MDFEEIIAGALEAAIENLEVKIVGHNAVHAAVESPSDELFIIFSAYKNYGDVKVLQGAERARIVHRRDLTADEIATLWDYAR